MWIRRLRMMIRSIQTLTDLAAQLMGQAAIDRAHELGVALSIAIVDAAGDSIYAIRLDGAPALSPRAAQAKAWTAAALSMSSSDWGNYISGNPTSMPVLFDDRLSGLPGGLPLELDGSVVGAVGCSGGTGEQDVAVAVAARDALRSTGAI
jgi:glc operon protein GlcG